MLGFGFGRGLGLDVMNLEGIRKQMGVGKGKQDPRKQALTTAQKIVDKFHDNPQHIKKMIGGLERMQSAQGGLPKALGLLLGLLRFILQAILGGNVADLLNGGLAKLFGGGGMLGNLFNGGGGGFFANFFGGGGGGRAINFDRMRPWSEEDKQFLDKALVSNSESFGNQISAWRQGQEGNCSSVACIKAAIDRYDNQVFDSVTRNGDGYDIKMQDGHNTRISDQELSMARAASNFRGQDGPAKSYAHLCYAAMAKRALGEGHEGASNYQQALYALNNGENPWDTARFLGLKNQAISVRPSDLNGQDSVVAYSNRHAIFVDKNNGGGHTSDHYGTGYRFSGTDTNGWGLRGAFTFRARGSGGGGNIPSIDRNLRPSDSGNSPRGSGGNEHRMDSNFSFEIH